MRLIQLEIFLILFTKLSFAFAHSHDLSLLIDTTKFPAFSIMLQPGKINYEISDEDIFAMHTMQSYHFPVRNGKIYLLDASENMTDSIKKYKHQPITHLRRYVIDYFFNRTKFSIEYMASINFPIISPYLVWHVRTLNANDIVYGYNPHVHSYILNESDAGFICAAYMNLSLSSLHNEHIKSVYVSSTSAVTKSECKNQMNGKVPVIFQDSKNFSTVDFIQSRPENAIDTFIDLFIMFGGSELIYSGSSLSDFVVTVNSMTCKYDKYHSRTWIHCVCVHC